MKKLSFVVLALLAGLALACASGCNPQTGIMIPDNPAIGEPEGNNPPDSPDVPDVPDTPNIGGIAVIIPRLFITQAEKALYEGLDSAEVDQAFGEIAEQTMNVQVGLEGNGLSYTERTATRQADGSYILTIPSLTPGVYALSVYTVTGNNLIGWRRDGILATVRAGQTTDLSIALERVAEIDCSGPLLTLPGTYAVDDMGKWAEAEVWVNLTSGQSVPGIGKTILGTYWFDTWVPVWAFVKSITVIDDNSDQYELEVSVTDGYSPYGWCIFDRIDSKVASAEYTDSTSEDEGEIDVVVDPIDPDDTPDYDPAKFGLWVTTSAPIYVGANVTVFITWPEEFGQWMFIRNDFHADFMIDAEMDPLTFDAENHRWVKSFNGHFVAPGIKRLAIRFFEAPGDSSPIAFSEVTLDVGYSSVVTTPTIEFSCPAIPGGRIPVSIRIPSANDMREFLVNPHIGQIAYIGVAGPNGNWVWNQETSPSSPDVVAITIADPDVIGLTTSFEPWATNHFRGTLFAVDINGNASFFNLEQWMVNYGINTSVVVDDGNGNPVIDFVLESGGC